MAKTPTARIEVRVSPRRRARYLVAAARRHLSLSEWARGHLDQAADAELAAPVPAEPSDADVAAALEGRGALRRSRVRERVAALKGAPWS
jgi:hypothetical protein